MQFNPVTLVVNSANVVFTPYDKGLNGAFVYRKDGVSLQAPRLIVQTQVNDDSSDKSVLQINTPRVKTGGVGEPDTVLGSDMVKSELRFLATTIEADRVTAIDTHIAALTEFRDTFEKREKIYS